MGGPETRRASRTVWAGGVRLGGGAPVAVEAPLSPPAGRDRAAVTALRAEAVRLERAGADLLRLDCASDADIEVLRLLAPGCAAPLLADIGGGDPGLALAAVEAGARGVWLSPEEQDDAALGELAALARSHGCVIGVRVGMSGGQGTSVGAASAPIALARRAAREAGRLAARGCADVLVALRVDDPLATVAAMRALGRACDWPLALAPGAAAPGTAGAAAAMAVGLPLAQGFGDLVRLARAADPVAETRAAVQALRTLGLRPLGVELAAEEGFARLFPDAPAILAALEDRLAHLRDVTVRATLSARASTDPAGPSLTTLPAAADRPGLQLLVACGGAGVRHADPAGWIAGLIEDRVAGARARDLHALAAALDRGAAAPAARAWIEAAVALFALERGRAPPIVWGSAIGEAAWTRLTGRRPAWQVARGPGADAGGEAGDELLSASALSTALGLALAGRHAGRPADVVAVVGPGALAQAAGLAAIRDARAAAVRMLIVLLDPDLDDAGLPGEVAAGVSRVVSSGPYLALRDLGKRLARSLPGPGYALARRAEEFARGAAAGGFMFDELGVYYVGPVAGRRYDQLLPVLRNLRDARRDQPVLLHVAASAGAAGAITGAGAAPDEPLAAELDRALGGDASRVLIAQSAGLSAAARAALARRHPGRVLVARDAAHHGLGLARGLAAGGARPLLLLDRRGLWSEAGEALRFWPRLGLPATLLVDVAAGASDLAWLDAPPLEPAALPGVAVMHASTPDRVGELIDAAEARPEPLVVVAFAQGPAAPTAAAGAPVAAEGGPARRLRAGGDAVILALGRGVAAACAAADGLAARGIGVGVVDAVTAQPFDAGLARRLAADHGLLVVLDDPPMAARIAPAVQAALGAGAEPRLRVVRFGRRAVADLVAAVLAARA
jgi:1-deoxy-D-xylulose-5-phosphate synthase